MKIAIFSDTFYPKIDGISTTLQEHTRFLARKGHKIKIFCPEYPGDYPKINLCPNVTVERFFSLPLPSYAEVRITFPNKRRIINSIASFKPDIIHMYTPGPIGGMAKFCKKYFNIPIIGTYTTLIAEQIMYIHPSRLLKIDWIFENFLKKVFFEKNKKNGFLEWLVWKLSLTYYKNCDIILVPSLPILKELKKRRIKNNIGVLSLGINFNKIKKRQSNNKIKYAILHVGRLSHEKKVEYVIEAFAKILKEIPDSTLDIIGDGPSKKSLMLQAKLLKINKNIRFFGYLNRERLLKIYSNYDIFITASTMETLGLVVLEAMSAGLPVVGVDKYAIPTLVIHNKNGLICKPDNPHQLAYNCIKILKNPKLFKKFGEYAKKIAMQHDIKKVIIELENIYQRLIN